MKDKKRGRITKQCPPSLLYEEATKDLTKEKSIREIASLEKEKYP